MIYESVCDFINMIICEFKYEKFIIDLLFLKKKRESKF